MTEAWIDCVIRSSDKRLYLSKADLISSLKSDQISLMEEGQPAKADYVKDLILRLELLGEKGER